MIKKDEVFFITGAVSFVMIIVMCLLSGCASKKVIVKNCSFLIDDKYICDESK